MLGKLGLLACASIALASCNSAPSGEINIVGSSTVYPFTKAVADAFVQAEKGRAVPKIESIGTGAGFARFCEGSGPLYPDIADASRRMLRAEFDKCQANKTGDIVEVVIGLDGIALAESNAGPKLMLTLKDIYLALAANPRGKPNSAKSWKEVNPALPAIPILVMGPPRTSGTRDAFVELILERGCLAAMPEAQELKANADPSRFESVCRQIRADGAYAEKGEDDNQIVTALEQNPNALGLFGYSYLEESKGRLHGVPIDGTPPSYDAIASGKYSGFRSLYLYVKKKHLEAKPQLAAFLELYTTMWAPGGPLARHGLIPASDKQRARSAEAIKLALPLGADSLR